MNVLAVIPLESCSFWCVFDRACSLYVFNDLHLKPSRYSKAIIWKEIYLFSSYSVAMSTSESTVNNLKYYLFTENTRISHNSLSVLIHYRTVSMTMWTLRIILRRFQMNDDWATLIKAYLSDSKAKVEFFEKNCDTISVMVVFLCFYFQLQSYGKRPFLLRS